MKLKFFLKIPFKHLFFIFTLLTVAITLPARTTVKAQAQPGGIQISPPSYELTANPGDVLDNVIKVTNLANNTVSYEAVVEDFRVEGDEGVVKVEKDDNPNAFSRWFKVTPSSFTLKKGETLNIKFNIDVPDDAEPGGHFASLMFQQKSIASESATGAQVLQRVGSLVLMTVSGDVKESGNISKFFTKSFVGSYETKVFEGRDDIKYFSTRDEKVAEEKPKSFFSNGPVAFDLVLENKGNVYYRPKEAKVELYNIFGKKVDTLNVEPKNVFPGGERRVTVIWPEKNLWGIRYTARLTAIYGQKEPKTLVTSTSFWAFPLPIAIMIAIILVVLILLRKRLFKAISILAKG